MTLNKREMKMAQEMARELVEAEKTSITVKQFIDYIVETVTNIWNQLKDRLSNILEHFYKSEKTIKEYNFKSRKLGWHVPIKMKMPQAPFVKNHNLRFARSNL